MGVSIITCPTCKTLLLSDTIQCPLCKHIFDEERAAMFTDDPLPSQAKSSTVEDVCRNCGEMVRRGLVRCWNCGAFMRRDIAASFRRMRDNPSAAAYTLPGEDAATGQEPEDKPARSRPSEIPEDEGTLAQISPDEADFQLAEETVADDDDFELDPGFAAHTPAVAPKSAGVEQSAAPAAPKEQTAKPEPETQDAGETYALQTPQSNAEAETSEKKPEADTGDQDQDVKPEQDQQADQDEKSSEPQDAEPKPGDEQSAPQEAHSVATGGDALLQVALSEEAETQERRSRGQQGRRARGARAPNRIMVYCPNGHRIEVHEKHRGKAGRCPKCKEMFSVPTKSWEDILAERAKAAAEAAGAGAAEGAAKKAISWLRDVHIHAVEPAKLKLTAGSLQKAFEPLDFAVTPEGLLAVKLMKKVGLGKAADKKKDPIRETVHEHLQEDKPLEELPAFEHRLFAPETIGDIRIVQPVAYEHESMFAGVPVFGVGRIAVRFPKLEGQESPYFASFTLSEFREFQKTVSERYMVEDLEQESHENGIPLTDEFTELQCHYTEQKLRVLENLDFYQNDPAFEVKHIGWRCQGCKLAISIDGQKKEKIGGKAGKGIAKAECPKCKAKFGDIKLFSIDVEPPKEQTADETAPGDETQPDEKENTAESKPDESSSPQTESKESAPDDSKGPESESADEPAAEADGKKE